MYLISIYSRFFNRSKPPLTRYQTLIKMKSGTQWHVFNRWRAPVTGRLVILGAIAILSATIAIRADDQPRGLPFIRSYSLDEIGSVPRRLRLGFDSFGRVAVMYDGIYTVLNDSTWVDRIDKSSGNKVRMTTIKPVNGNNYYGGRGSWGTVEVTPDGRYRAAPLVPPDAPEWTRVNAFNALLSTTTGVYFSDIGGVIYWDFARQKNFFFQLPRVITVFRVGERVFVSCQDHLLREILPDSGTTRVVRDREIDTQLVVAAAALDANQTLLALRGGRLVSFDGKTATSWPAQGDYRPYGEITAMEHLVDGGTAIAVDGKGIYLLSVEGKMRWVLNTPEFRHIGSMAANEPGVLWVTGENAVYRVFYDSALTSFGHETGLSVRWPTLAEWNDQTIVRSNGLLYQLEKPATPETLSHFNELPLDPQRQADCIAARGPHLLVGDSVGVMAVASNGKSTPVIDIENVTALDFIQPDICVVFASEEVAALRYDAGKWTECAPRIKGVGNSPITTFVHDAIWIEMGGSGVNRLTYNNGILEMKPFPLPWRDLQWTNVGAVGHLIVFSGPTANRAYYDETTQAFCESPELDRLLNRSPYWITRVRESDQGVIWASHFQGIVTFTPSGGDYVMDSATYELRNDSYPFVRLLPNDQVWITTGGSLYHVVRQRNHAEMPAPTALVSLVADHQNLELVGQTHVPAAQSQFSFDDNSLSFRFFSGTYAWRYPPIYEYRLGKTEPWTPVDLNMVLRFPKLRDGTYHLEVRPAEPHSAKTPLAFDFEIKPPIYRTPSSYLLYAILAGTLVWAVVRWTNHQSLKRNAFLKQQVNDRTVQLEVTMEKLAEETRNAATLSERSRLAGEIHDSLQQSLSGSILHLDTTMTHPSLDGEVRSRLDIVRRMMSYSREEIQQAVWNLQSPLLHDSSLGDALRKLAGFINTGTITVKVTEAGEQVPLDTTIQHNLLRIAQEAITNAVRHANPTTVDVSLQYSPEVIRLTVTDDGIGFDPLIVSKVAGHFGLRGLHSRAKSIKADLVVQSSPTSGTLVSVTVFRKTIQLNERYHQNQSA